MLATPEKSARRGNRPRGEAHPGHTPAAPRAAPWTRLQAMEAAARLQAALRSGPRRAATPRAQPLCSAQNQDRDALLRECACSLSDIPAGAIKIAPAIPLLDHGFQILALHDAVLHRGYHHGALQPGGQIRCLHPPVAEMPRERQAAVHYRNCLGGAQRARRLWISWSAGTSAGSSKARPSSLTRRCTISTSSSMEADTGRTTVLNRRFSALDSSFTPRSRLLAVAITLKPRTARTSIPNSGTGSDFSERMVISESCTSAGIRVSSSTRAIFPFCIAIIIGLGTTAFQDGPSASRR